MPKGTPTSTRAPRGSKPVSQAFFAALDAVPEASRSAVAKAAQVMIRDELKVRREKVKAMAVKKKAGAASLTRRPAKPAAREGKGAVSAVPAIAKRTRKQPEAPAEA